MERAIYFSDYDKLKEEDLRNYSRIYFGNEFCDELTPELDTIKEVVSMIGDKEKLFTLMTCYVSEDKIRNYYKIIELLAKLKPGSEVVINDWGILNICLQNNLSPVLGRLLVRQKRDPRISHFIRHLPELPKIRMEQTGLNKYFTDFIKRHKIKRMELDNLLQGIDMAELQYSDFSYSVYLPYGYITTSRICLLRCINTGRHIKRLNSLPCSYACRNGLFKLRNKHIKETLFIKGNTLFFKNYSESFLEDESRIDRIVYEPEIPD